MLDWGREGLFDTLQSLQDAGVRTVGAGLDAVEEALAGCPVSEQTYSAAGAAAADGVRVSDDYRASAAYRTDMVRVFTRRGVEQVLKAISSD